MAQIFRPSHNTLALVSLLIGAVAPLGLIVGGSQLTNSNYITRVEVPYEQPVPFSHEHHVTELGLDCRYCHTTVEKSANAGYPTTHTCMTCHSQVWTNSPLLEPIRESYTKNVPIKWTKLNQLPDFVYFNHSIHIKRGVSCNNCHGPVQSMQMAYKGKAFEMKWCLDCHRKPENAVNKQEFVWELYRKIQAGEKLTAEEQTLASGKQYTRNATELEAGKALVDQYKVKKQQLSDCWTCHR